MEGSDSNSSRFSGFTNSTTTKNPTNAATGGVNPRAGSYAAYQNNVLKQIGSDSADPADYIFTKHEDFVKAGVNQTPIYSRLSVFPASLGYHWHGGFASIPDAPEPESVFQQLHEMACF